MRKKVQRLEDLFQIGKEIDCPAGDRLCQKCISSREHSISTIGRVRTIGNVNGTKLLLLEVA